MLTYACNLGENKFLKIFMLSCFTRRADDRILALHLRIKATNDKISKKSFLLLDGHIGNTPYPVLAVEGI
jgi:hypothetical protein